MNRINRDFLRLSFGRAWAITALVLALPMGTVVAQESKDFNVAAQDAASGLRALALQADFEILMPQELVDGKIINAVDGRYAPEEALHRMLQGTGLKYRATGPNTYVVEEGELTVLPFVNGAAGSTTIAQQEGATQASPEAPAVDPATVDPGVNATGQATTANVQVTRTGGIEEIIVTGQKKEERLQDVPIAISAFSAEDLSEQKIEGGFDLLKAIPNVTFSKSNFSSYNFSIRGIGTKAVSATTDPGVAIAFNNTALIQNRLFEQEYFDVERVEVLRGPQGTLFGRNATAGVVNVISSKPDFDEYKGNLKFEGGNYDTRRIVAMGNAPIIDNVLALRVAGAMTQREGYDYNEITGNPVNGRDLWSGRLTLGFNPTDRIRTYLLWERFEEDDDRARTGKQLCHRDPGPDTIGSTPVVSDQTPATELERAALMRPALFSQGCKPGSLYADEAFGTPNGLALPFVFAPLALGNGPGALFGMGNFGDGISQTLIGLGDPYGGMMQSRDLRTIASFRDPRYEASADLLEFSFEADLSDVLTFTSQTAYNEDTVYSFQDFNRFNTLPVFTDTSQFVDFGGQPNKWVPLMPGGVFCDPQLGCSDRLAGFDISQAEGRQFSQEFRLQSSSDGPYNFSVGANYTQFDTLVDYYVFYNIITALAMSPPFNGTPELNMCSQSAFPQFALPVTGVPIDDPRAGCSYIDPNPIESINGEGHNYFRSKNPYELRSTAMFGEFYWNIQDDLKLTAGLRYTDDTKTFIPVPSQILLGKGILSGGTTARGYPEKPAIELHWGEFTGRLGLDWKPELSFTDQTLLYAFYSRGYKGGGANPPSPGFATGEELVALARELGVQLPQLPPPVLQLNAVEYGRTFEPEFVNAFEIGMKNTLFNGSLLLNAGAFYYDYTDYQVSQIRDRTAVNENFDAKIWGLELEVLFSPTPDLKINANLGYLQTRIANSEGSVDIMNRTQSDPDYVVVKPWAQLPSNCVVPTGVAEAFLNSSTGFGSYWNLCGGARGYLDLLTSSSFFIDPATGQPYDFRNYPEINGGAGVRADLGGNELPNSPNWTANLGVQYGMDFARAWRVTGRIDGYYQGESWARVYNADPYDQLRSWYNVNLSTWVEQIDWGLKVEVYAKNLLNDTPITDAFLNSDDTALTTNVFVLDPRLIGISIRKDF